MSGLSGSGLLLKVFAIDSLPKVRSIFVYKLSIYCEEVCV